MRVNVKRNPQETNPSIPCVSTPKRRRDTHARAKRERVTTTTSRRPCHGFDLSSTTPWEPKYLFLRFRAAFIYQRKEREREKAASQTWCLRVLFSRGSSTTRTIMTTNNDTTNHDGTINTHKTHTNTHWKGKGIDPTLTRLGSNDAMFFSSSSLGWVLQRCVSMSVFSGLRQCFCKKDFMLCVCMEQQNDTTR